MTMERVPVPAETVQAGDFTIITGYRPVASVRRRPRRREVILTWTDGQRRTVPYGAPVTLLRRS